MNSTDHRRERIGEIMVLAQACIYGFFPVILSYSGGKIPPLFFAAVSTGIAGVIILLYTLATGKIYEIRNAKIYRSVALLAVFMVTGYSCLYVGGSQTSGINISILAQVEIVFTFFIAGLFLGEPMPSKKIYAAVAVLVGSLMIVYNGGFTPHPADMLILAATLFFPIANHHAQQALKIVSPQVVLLARSVLCSLGFLLLSFLWEGTATTAMLHIENNVGIILINGLIIFSLTKILWYEGLHRLELSKAITLGMTFTAFGFLYSVLLLAEIPTIYQMIGFVFVMIGVYILTRKKRREPEHLIENI